VIFRNKVITFFSVVVILILDSYIGFGLEVQTKTMIILGLVAFMLGEQYLTNRKEENGKGSRKDQE